MTATMSISRIPVPVRNFDETIRHRTISAKTRLERLRDDFQRKLLFEKQAKLHDFYSQELHSKTNQQMRSAEIRYDHYRNTEVTANSFGEREGYVSGQRNGYTSSNNNNNVPSVSGRLRRRPPLPPYIKRSAGRDRAHLLAPINPARPNLDGPKTRGLPEIEDASLAPTPDYLGDTYILQNPNLDRVEQKLEPRPPPIVSRPKIMRPHLQNRMHQVQFKNESERLKQEKLRQLNEEVSDGPNHSLQKLGRHSISSPADESLSKTMQRTSDYQKWQLEQNQERARRLQRLNRKSQNQTVLPFNKENGIGDVRGEPQEEEESELHMEDDNEDSEQEDVVSRQKQKILQRHNRKETDDLDEKVDFEEEDLEDQRLKQKERELQELIRRQEEELQKLRLEKFDEAEEEKRKEIRNKKLQDKFLQQKQQILEAEKLQQKARHDLSTPKQKAGHDLSTPKQKAGHDLCTPPPQRTLETTSSQKPSGSKPLRRTSLASLPPKQTWKPEIDPNNEETAFYLQKAISEGNYGANEIKLVPCHICGRSFANNRLAKHEKICSKESKKTRKVFDPVAMRYRGTEFENHVKRRRDSIAEEPLDEKKSHWRTKHQNFIDTIQYAKKVAKVQSKGGSLSSLPPPPVTINPDYVQCPHCQRRFNKNAADRHIPWCKDTKSRQPPKPKGHRH